MEKNEKSNGKLLVVLLIIVSLLLCVAVGYIVYDKFISNSNYNPEIVKEKDDNNEPSDSNIEQQIKNKINILEGLADIDGNNDNNPYMWKGEIYSKDLKASELSNDVKLYSILKPLYIEKYRGKSPVTTDYVSELDKTYLDQIDVSEVESEYKLLYETSDYEHKELSGCPMFLYDSKNAKYYGGSECGGNTSNSLHTYISDVVT